MRFSEIQEEHCEIGLEQGQVPDVASESMMSAAGDTTLPAVQIKSDNSPVYQNSMVSNLPLVFADGYPTSLENMSLVSCE